MPVAANLSGQLEFTQRKHGAAHPNQLVITEQCIVEQQAYGTAVCSSARATAERAAMARARLKGAQEADDSSDEKMDVPTTSTDTPRRCVSTQSTPLIGSFDRQKSLPVLLLTLLPCSHTRIAYLPHHTKALHSSNPASK